LAAFVHSQQVWHACADAVFALLVQQDCCTFCTAALQHLAAGCGRLASPTATHAAASANDVAIIFFMSFLPSFFFFVSAIRPTTGQPRLNAANYITSPLQKDSLV
jgi:hypothetical protein